MRYARNLILAMAVALTGCGPARQRPGEDRPALVVLLVVDQLRADLLDRYAPVLTGGFARLLRDGRVFRNASHRHASTSTAVGHTTLSTGVTPSRHGIVGNDFWVWDEEGPGSTQYSVADPLSPIVGFPDAEGRSPRNLLRGGLADWMVEADPDTRVVSISRKDRAAIPLAGRTTGHVYWILTEAGQFVTSTHYRHQYPEWVTSFNQSVMPVILGDSLWTRSTPDPAVALARRDSAVYEGDGIHVTFPHRRGQETVGDAPEEWFEWAGETSAPDRAVLELARVAVRAEGLGKRSSGPDLLALSFSQTDYVGHAYGPLSQEQLSNLVHLDGLLAELWELLDEEVGHGRWVVGLSADHGVMTIPEWLAEEGGQVRRLSRDEIAETRRVAAEAAAGAGPVQEMRGRVAAAVENLPWVERVYRPEELTGEPADSMTSLFGYSYLENRSWGTLGRYGVYLQVAPGFLYRSEARGTSHGSPYWHDRHVPLIVYREGLSPDVSDEPVYTYDLAPTLGALSGTPLPADLDGRPLIYRSGGNP